MEPCAGALHDASMRPALLGAVGIACLLFVPFVSAVLVQTPLAVSPSKRDPAVGAEVTFAVTLQNQSAKAQFAGRTFPVQFTHDASTEGADPVVGNVGNVTLDANAAGTFRWTVPASAQDKNVFVTVLDGNETLGTAHVAVGNAPAIMFAEGGGAGPVANESAGPTPTPSSARSVPMGGLVLVVLSVVGSALLLRSRR